MANVTVIGEDGTVQTRPYGASNSSFTLEIDGIRYEPALVDTIEVESNAQQATTGTMCGDQTTTNTSKDPFKVTVSGIITNSGSPSELTVEDLLFDVHEGDELSFTSDFPNMGPMTVSNVLVRQEEELVSIQTGLHAESQTAFRFQLQFGEESNRNDATGQFQ